MPTRAAPVSVAKQKSSSTSCSSAKARASAKTKRPSASVFSISTVSPLRLGKTSPGRNALPEILFSAIGKSTRKFKGSFAPIIMEAIDKAVALPPISFFIKFMAAPGFKFKPPVSKQMPLPTNVTFGSDFLPQFNSINRGAWVDALPTA